MAQFGIMLDEATHEELLRDDVRVSSCASPTNVHACKFAVGCIRSNGQQRTAVTRLGGQAVSKTSWQYKGLLTGVHVLYSLSFKVTHGRSISEVGWSVVIVQVTHSKENAIHAI
jgi:hypothetical protein